MLSSDAEYKREDLFLTPLRAHALALRRTSIVLCQQYTYAQNVKIFFQGLPISLGCSLIVINAKYRTPTYFSFLII